MVVENCKLQGRTINGYNITRYLGSGGFSWVLEGKKDGKTYALKFTKQYDRKEKSKKFLRQREEIIMELDILKAVKHKNILKLKSFRECEYLDPQNLTHMTYCFVLETCQPFDLFDILYHTGKLEESLAKCVFLQIAAAVRCLHEAGYAHRDIKPQNILFTSTMVAKLCDFGGAKKTNGNMSTTRVGTRGYQAPELLLNRDYTKRVDVFSLGVLLFVMTTGHPPFQHALITDRWFRCLAKDPPQAARFWGYHKKDNPSEYLKNLIEGMLCYQPSHRMRTVQLFSHGWLRELTLSPAKYVELMKARFEKCKRASENTRSEKFADLY